MINWDELPNWINDHKDIQIYSSYNNNLNTHDYPSMYKKVIASGTGGKIDYKDIDVKYQSNNIFIINNGIHYYSGNSFLSIITMFQ